MSRQLRCRKTDRGSDSLTSDVLLRLCHEPFQSKLTKALPLHLASRGSADFRKGVGGGKGGGGVMRSSGA